MFYGEVFKALNKARVKYVVAGGVAVALYGFLRYTKDVDLIIHLEEKNVIKLFDALEPIRFSSLYGKRIKVRSEGVTVPLISLEHLRILKRRAGRLHDLADLEQLDAIQRFKNKRKRK